MRSVSEQIARIFREHRVLLILLLVTAAVYARALGHQFLLTWDDNFYVVDNDAIRGFSPDNIRTVFTSYYTGNYAPLQMLSYMLDFTIWGMRPAGFIATNILLHLANGVLAYRLFLRFHGERLLAAAGSAIFLLHPVQVESVAWISQRKTVLALFFFLLAWEWYCRYRKAGPGRGRGAYLVALAAFVLAVLSKSVAVIFPVVMFTFDNIFPTGENKGSIRGLLPFLLVAGGIAIATAQIQIQLDGGWNGSGGGRAAGYHGGTPLATFLTMLPVFCSYLKLLLWPTGLSVLYDPPVYRTLTGVVGASALLLAGLLCLALLLLRRERRLGFWPLYSLLAILPVSQLVPLITLINDRYLYFPLLGTAALGGAATVWLRGRFGRPGLLPLFVVLALLALVSRQRLAVWHDDVSLWRDTVAQVPAKSDAWEKLGEAYHTATPPDYRSAQEAYARALAISPNAFSLYNLGILYYETGNHAKALAAVTQLLVMSPDHVMGLKALGDIQLKRGEYGQAEEAYSRALTLQPEAMPVQEALVNLRRIRARQVGEVQ